MESKEQALSKAWEILEEGDKEREALDYALPWAADGDGEACTVCALAYLYLGESDLCDKWTLRAAEMGAREDWSSRQNEFEDLVLLICRFDALSTLGTETFIPALLIFELERYLLDGSLEFSLYYEIRALRNLWESDLINRDIGMLSNYLATWIITSKFDAQTLEAILGDLEVCTTGALSTKEATTLVKLIEESLGN